MKLVTACVIALALVASGTAYAAPPTEDDWAAVQRATFGRSCHDYVPPPARPTGNPFDLIPQRAVSEGIGGWAFVYFEVEPTGDVSNARILASDPDGLFDAAALAAAAGFKYVQRATRCEGVSVLIEFERDISPTGISEYNMTIKRPVAPVSPEALVAQLTAPRCDPVPVLDDESSFIAALARHYPQQALDETGWVAVRFDVSTLGAAENVVIIDSEPTTSFDAAALALMGDMKFESRSSACPNQVTLLRFVPQVIPR